MAWTFRVTKSQLMLMVFMVFIFLMLKSNEPTKKRHHRQTTTEITTKVYVEKYDDGKPLGSVVVPLYALLEGPFKLNQEDPYLINYIKTQINSGAGIGKSLNLSSPVHSGQIGQAEEVANFYKGMKNGVFLEAGAWDGEYLSNTLYLEVKLNWTGLLVEPNEGAFDILKKRNRKAKSINSCISINRYPEKVVFDAADVFGGINEKKETDEDERMKAMRNSIPKHMRSKYPVQCFPLYSLLIAAGLPRVDLLSLDIEGAELNVLETVPWEKVDIGMVMIEVEHSNRTAIDEIMLDAGFKVYKEMEKQDVIYVKS